MVRNIEVSTQVIVIGSSTTNLSCQRLVTRAGYTVYAACREGSWPTRSRHFRPVVNDRGQTWQGELGKEGHEFLRRLNFSRCVLIPAADDAALWLADLPRDLQDRFFVSSSSLSTLMSLQDKSLFAGLLTRLSVACPRSFAIETEADFKSIPIADMDSLFLKPTDSQAFMAAYGKKAIWVKSEAQAISEWRRIHADGLALIAQEYVAGNADDHYFIDGFIDRDGVVRAKTARRRLRIYPVDFGNSSYCRSVPFKQVEDGWVGLGNLLADISYRGIFSAEFKLDSRDGSLKLLEVNTRPWVYVEFADRCGINMCELAINDALHNEVRSIATYRVDKSCVDLFHDLVGVIESPSAKRPNMVATLWVWVSSFKLLFSFADPWPALVFVKQLVARQLKKVFLRA